MKVLVIGFNHENISLSSASAVEKVEQIASSKLSSSVISDTTKILTHIQSGKLDLITSVRLQFQVDRVNPDAILFVTKENNKDNNSMNNNKNDEDSNNCNVKVSRFSVADEEPYVVGGSVLYRAALHSRMLLTMKAAGVPAELVEEDKAFQFLKKHSTNPPRLLGWIRIPSSMHEEGAVNDEKDNESETDEAAEAESYNNDSAYSRVIIAALYGMVAYHNGAKGGFTTGIRKGCDRYEIDDFDKVKWHDVFYDLGIVKRKPKETLQNYKMHNVSLPVGKDGADQVVEKPDSDDDSSTARTRSETEGDDEDIKYILEHFGNCTTDTSTEQQLLDSSPTNDEEKIDDTQLVFMNDEETKTKLRRQTVAYLPTLEQRNDILNWRGGKIPDSGAKTVSEYSGPMSTVRNKVSYFEFKSKRNSLNKN